MNIKLALAAAGLVGIGGVTVVFGQSVDGFDPEAIAVSYTHLTLPTKA